MPTELEREVDEAAKKAVRKAGLRYVSDSQPGIARERVGRDFAYRYPDGTLVRDPEELQTIRSIAIPPVWQDVWVCLDENGHLQATGRDARGRKQYRYHKRWQEVRDEAKFGRMVLFGEAIPVIRERTDEDLSRRSLSERKVLAALVRLLDETLLRVGNTEYRDANDSYGLTTLRDEHVSITGEHVRFRFRGKAGKDHMVRLRDARLARAVKRIRELPGQELFQYVNGDGEPRVVESGQVNDYLREITAEEFTSKDFRTWGATSLAALELQACGTLSRKAAERAVVEAIKNVADHLGNTPAICRRSYVHPFVIESFLAGTLCETWREVRRINVETPLLRAEEQAVLELLRQAS